MALLPIPPILLTEFPVDFNISLGGFVAAGKQATAENPHRLELCLTASPDLNAAVGEDRDVLSSGLSGYVEGTSGGCQHPGRQPCQADGADPGRS